MVKGDAAYAFTDIEFYFYNKNLLKGPMACAEIFRLHSACGGCDFPTLVMKETGKTFQNISSRHHLVKKDNDQEIEKKVKYILSAYSNGNDENLQKEMIESFKKFKEMKYRYSL